MVDIKKLKPLGVALILICAVLAVIICVTADLGVPDRYVSAHDTEYYRTDRGTMQELLDEFRNNVLPGLQGVKECRLNDAGDRVEVTIEGRYYARMRAVILRDFDASLFDIVRAE